MEHKATKKNLGNGKFSYTQTLGDRVFTTKSSKVDYKFAYATQAESGRVIGGFSRTLEGAQKSLARDSELGHEQEIIGLES